ncbi:hypothetical protein C4573_01015 [Candidatus Woesearchaeota archaeon]|nr:MAG: hypothetical protein C4573_01015 [Candidatus Woesearchaeota archaeon]
MQKIPLFTNSELAQLLLASASMGLIFFFWKWRKTDFDVASGISFFIFSVLAVFLFVVIARSVQKYVARKRGYLAVYQSSRTALGLTTVLSFFSFGALVVVAPGQMELRHQAAWRLGKFQYQLRYKDVAAVAFTGPLVHIMLAFVMHFFYVSKTATPVVYYLIFINLFIAMFALLPLPYFDGINVLMHSRMLYIFLLVFVISFSLLVLLTNFFAFIIALLLAILFAGAFLFIFER